ncbi:unnamed protein product [Cercopithifilaria johnstoni]|uniref:Uncharacterized protein n=1 Tax=Cercopithifilaria johnstoni TaxID=2874296 RepID=A0A8J2QAV2_9BILA|nr:unnamed protein product [Cercopithifilaria johnstoni]
MINDNYNHTIEETDQRFFNGCKSHPPCPPGLICAEKLVPCISRSCRKIAKCVPPGTCEAMECPPSHKCVMNPGPTCVRTILTAEDVAKMNQN